MLASSTHRRTVAHSLHFRPTRATTSVVCVCHGSHVRLFISCAAAREAIPKRDRTYRSMDPAMCEHDVMDSSCSCGPTPCCACSTCCHAAAGCGNYRPVYPLIKPGLGSTRSNGAKSFRSMLTSIASVLGYICTKSAYDLRAFASPIWDPATKKKACTVLGRSCFHTAASRTTSL